MKSIGSCLRWRRRWHSRKHWTVPWRTFSGSRRANYLSVREEIYELCFAAEVENDPRIRALEDAVRSSSYRKLLQDLPGCDPLAERIYAGEWSLMPILGGWLLENGYGSEGEHCLDPNTHHVKGCWVVDWVTGRE